MPPLLVGIPTRAAATAAMAVLAPAALDSFDSTVSEQEFIPKLWLQNCGGGGGGGVVPY